MKYTPLFSWFPADKRAFLRLSLSALICLGFIVNPFLAQAARISNLSSEAHEIEMLNGANVTKITIEAGRSHETVGALKLRYHGQEFYIESFEEYAIWKDGMLGPQFRQQNKRARN